MAMMKYGDKTRIANHAGVSLSFLKRYLNGESSAKQSTIDRIDLAINELKIDIDPHDVELTEVYKLEKTNKLRIDILNNLAKGDQIAVANKLGTSAQSVNNILHGRFNQSSPRSIEVIKECEKLAAINIWKTRFCRTKSLL